MSKCLLCKQELEHVLTHEIRQGEGTVRVCVNCNLGVLDDAYAEGYYKKAYRKEYGPMHKGTEAQEEFDAMYQLQDKRVKLVREIAWHKKDLLDIGCSAGQFLYAMKDFHNRVDGLELNKDFAEFANKKLGDRGTVYTAKSSIKKKYDIITCFQTLEHITNPHTMLKFIKRVAKKDAIIIIEVPNLNDSLLTMYNLPEYKKIMFHKAHKWYFTNMSLLTLMQQAGFDGKIAYTQDFGLFNHLYWSVYGKGQGNYPLGHFKLRDIKIHEAKEGIPEIEFLRDLLEFTEDTYIHYLKVLGITSNITFIGKVA